MDDVVESGKPTGTVWVYMDDVVESGKPTGTVWVYMDDPTPHTFEKYI